MLSLNDNPIAMVSSGELLNVQKAGDQARQTAAPVEQKLFFDLRNAVMTQDLLNQMNAIGQQAALAGGQMGSSGAQEALARQARGRLA